MNNERSDFFAHWMGLTAGSIALVLSFTATAGDDNRSRSSASASASLGRTVVLGGLRAGGYESYLRFSNLGSTAGTARVTLYDAKTGTEFAIWDSVLIPGRGALQVSLGDIAKGKRLEATAGYVAMVAGAFKGQVQHVAWSPTGGVVTDLTSCGELEMPENALGYIAGPGSINLKGVVRIGNEGTRARGVKLALRDAATGAVLGTWTSPDIAARGAFEISAAKLAADAVAPVPAATTALTVMIDGSAAQMTLSYLEGIGDGVVTDLSAGCKLRGGGSGETGDDDDEGEDADEDEVEIDDHDDDDRDNRRRS